jgi:hypothetical protein
VATSSAKTIVEEIISPAIPLHPPKPNCLRSRVCGKFG